jgi:hypothetical protein
MKKGDFVIYRGVVLDIVEDAVLTKSSSADEREHWFKAEHLSVDVEGGTVPSNIVEIPAATTTSAEIEQAVKNVMAKGYDEAAARKIVAQLGPETFLEKKPEPLSDPGQNAAEPAATPAAPSPTEDSSS